MNVRETVQRVEELAAFTREVLSACGDRRATLAIFTK